MSSDSTLPAEVGPESFEEPFDVRRVGVRREPDTYTARVAESEPLRRLVGVEASRRGVHAMIGQVPADGPRVVAGEGDEQGGGPVSRTGVEVCPGQFGHGALDALA